LYSIPGITILQRCLPRHARFGYCTYLALVFGGQVTVEPIGALLAFNPSWRLLFAALGVNIEAITLIVSVFMFGLGVGSLVGGVLSAGPDRLTAAGAAGLPQVIAPGALDMVNFGPPDTVPDRFSSRLFFEHNPSVTLMRTTAAEMAELGARIGRKAAAATGPAEVFWPDRGVSALDADGQPFRDPAADEACREALDRELAAAGRSLHRMDAHVNDPIFAIAMADRLHQMITNGS